MSESEQSLKEAELKADQTVAQWDEDPTFIAKAQLGLKKGNAAFAKYRASECAFASSLGEQLGRPLK